MDAKRYNECIGAWNCMKELRESLQGCVNQDAFLQTDPRKAYESARRALRISRRIVAHLEQATLTRLTL